MSDDLIFIYQILSSLNGNDLERRKIAENELNKIKNINKKEFFVKLLEIFNNQLIEPHVRRLSGLILKNDIQKCNSSDKIIVYNWLSVLNEKIRKEFKEALLENFSSSSKIIRRTVSQLLAKIAFIELKHNLWDNFFEELYKYLFNGNRSNYLYEGILETIEFLFQEVSDTQQFFCIFKNKSTIILEIILIPIKEQTREEENLHFAALKTFCAALQFIDLNKLKEFDFDLIFSLIINQLTHSSLLIRRLGFEILEIMVKKYYGKIGKFISIIFDLILITIEQDEDDVILKAIEFWSTLADEEFQINLNSIQALSEGRIPRSYSKQLIMKSGSIMPFILLSFIENRKISENEDSNCKSATGLCLNLMSQAGPSEILPRLVDFIENQINLCSKLKSKYTAVFSLIAIFDGVGSKILYNHLFKTSFLWLSFLENENRELRGTVLFLFGKIFQISPFLLRANLDQVVQILLKNLFYKKNEANIFWILNEVFQSFESEGLLEWYLETICSIVFNLISQQISRGKMAGDLFELICSFILNSSTRSQSSLFLLIPTTLKALKSSFITDNISSQENTIKIQSYLFRFVGSSIQRLGQKFTPIFTNEIISFIYILIEMARKLKFDSDLEDEIIIFIGTVIQKYKKESKILISEIMPILFDYVKKNTDHQGVSVAIGIFGDIFSSYENLNGCFVKKATSILIDLLQSDEISLDTKPLIISCIGDLSFASGGYFLEFQTMTIPIVKSIVKSIYNYEKSADEDIFEWVLTIKESLLESLTGLIQSDPVNVHTNKFFDINCEFIWLIRSIYEMISNDRINRTTKLCIGLIGDCGVNYKSKKKNLKRCTWVKQLIFESMVSDRQNLNFMGNWASESIYKV